MGLNQATSQRDSIQKDKIIKPLNCLNNIDLVLGIKI